MKLFLSIIVVLGLLFPSFNAIPIDSNDCSLSIGERDNLDVRHRRMVDVNLHPERCEDSDVVSIDIPHDGITRSFHKVRNIRLKQSNTGKTEKDMGEDSTLPENRFSYWYGEDNTDGSSFNYVQDEVGNIQGSLVDMSSDSVMQFSIEDGRPTVIITDSSKFRPEIHPPHENLEQGMSSPEIHLHYGLEDEELFTDTTEIATNGNRIAKSNLRTNSIPSKQDKKRRNRNMLTYDDSGENLDVMVVWTRKAECKNSHLPEGCTLTSSTKLNMEALINLAIHETNTAYDLSGVETKLYLAHSYRHPTYSETSIRMTDSLHALQKGNISGTEENRVKYGADIVAMILDDSMFCGIGFIGPRIDRMYSVSSWNCATGYFSFGHELGHNLGLKHDRGSSYECSSRKFNFGYRDPQARFRTILAYQCMSGQCDNNSGGGCTRIQRFSNPLYTWNGLPVGTKLDDNARTINKVRKKVAKYFPHGGTENPPTLPLQPPTSPSSKPTKSSTEAPSTFASQFPSLRPSSKPSESPHAHPSVFPSKSPSLFPSSNPSSFPSKSATSFPSSIPSGSPQIVPSTFPSKYPSSSPSSEPSSNPTLEPSSERSLDPSQSSHPSTFPSMSSSPSSSSHPSTLPSKEVPSAFPSKFPTLLPSYKPSESPQVYPSTFPTISPTLSPTISPTISPTLSPSSKPSESPQAYPSTFPSKLPTLSPSSIPSESPQTYPSAFPSKLPTLSPSSKPSVSPHAYPSMSPSLSLSNKKPPTCNDSPLEFFYNNDLINCSIVGSENLCATEDLRATCRATCGTCSQYEFYDPTLKINVHNASKQKWQTKTCAWVADHPTVRCTFQGVKDTCRATCKSM